MQVAVEVEPFKSKRDLEWIAEVIGTKADLVDIPDLPLGKRLSSPVAAAYLAAVIGPGRVIAHVRTVDHSIHAIKGIAKTLLSLGVYRLVLLRGDPLGAETGPSPEEAFRVLAPYRERGLKLGFIISLRKPMEVIEERLNLDPDFVLVLNLTRERLEILGEVASRIEVIPYIIVRTQRNATLFTHGVSSLSLGPAEAVNLACGAGQAGAWGVLVSSPGDRQALAYVAGEVKRRCG